MVSSAQPASFPNQVNHVHAVIHAQKHGRTGTVQDYCHGFPASSWQVDTDQKSRTNCSKALVCRTVAAFPEILHTFHYLQKLIHGTAVWLLSFLISDMVFSLALHTEGHISHLS